MGRKAAGRFEAETRDPVRAQQRVLADIIEKNRATEYGRRFGFREIQTLAQWRRQVPVVDYEDLRPWVDRMGLGEENLLTEEPPLFFARTSGTTGAPKLIPVTRTCRRGQEDQIRAWFFHAWRDHPTIWDGKIVSLVSPAIEGSTPSGIPFGSTSGHMYRSLPRIARAAHAVPYEVFEIRDYEAQYYVIMLLGIGQDIRFVGTANPSSIVKLCEKADQHADALLKDLADGTLRAGIDVPPRTRVLIEERLRPQPVRASTLETARARRDGRFLPADYWPHLALVGCWKGGTVGAHVEKFGSWFDPDGTRAVPVRDWGFLSSEARASLPITDHGRGGVLSVGANLYEFVRADDVDNQPEGRDSWHFLGADEIVAGEEYYIFLTTPGGLYRYDINDVIAMTGTHHRTPIIEFRRKGRGVTSLTGEKVSVNQVIAAFEGASRALGVAIDHFKAEADVDLSRYVFKVEARLGIPPEVRPRLLRALEAELSEQNLEYRAKRKSQRLEDPVLHVMRVGWYDRQKQQQLDSGARMFQAKTVILSASEVSEEDPDLEAVVTLS